MREIETTHDGRRVIRTDDAVVTYAPYLEEYVNPPPKPVRHLHGNSNAAKAALKATTEALRLELGK